MHTIYIPYQPLTYISPLSLHIPLIPQRRTLAILLLQLHQIRRLNQLHQLVRLPIRSSHSNQDRAIRGVYTANVLPLDYLDQSPRSSMPYFDELG